LVLRILVLKIVEKLLELINVPFYLVLLEKAVASFKNAWFLYLRDVLVWLFICVFSLDGDNKFVIVVLYLVFELNVELNVGVVEATIKAGFVSTFVGVAWHRASVVDERLTSFLVNLELDARVALSTDPVAFGLNTLVVDLETSDCREGHE